MSTTQAPEPTSYIVEGDSYRKLIAERDAYKRIANDLARQLRERTPADTSAPPERAAPETSPVQAVCDRAAHLVDVRSAPEPPGKTWDCVCGRSNYVTYTRCDHCGFQRATLNR